MCDHKIKLAALNLKVPILNKDGITQLASGGVPVKIKKIVFCADPCCEQVFAVTYPDVDRKLTLVK